LALRQFLRQAPIELSEDMTSTIIIFRFRPYLKGKLAQDLAVN
jgi:hypothetical protein